MQTNPTYKQLEASMKVGGFTIGQWAEITVSAVVALVFAIYISPFSTAATVFVSIVVAGSPIALSYGAMAHEWSVVEALRAQWRWFKMPRRYLPGPGAASEGYVVTATADPEGSESRVRIHTPEHAEVLWDF